MTATTPTDRTLRIIIPAASYIALWIADDLLLCAPMVATVAAWGFWVAWPLWMTLFVAGNLTLCTLVINAAHGARIAGTLRRRLTAWLLRYAADDPVAQRFRRISGTLTITVATIALGPPIVIGVIALADERRPTRRLCILCSVVYAAMWVTTYTWIAEVILG